MVKEDKPAEIARRMIHDFAQRTGLTGTAGDTARRYLWTDALAVQTLFGLARHLEDETYGDLALRLISEVHHHLGRFRPNDERDGWISGLPEDEGKRHPTVGGLRIGKKLPERAPGEPVDQRLEWEQDGQYFHYLTRWVNALLVAHQETADADYARWASELILAGRQFLHERGSEVRMHWKMSTDLSRPLVPSMGAHDPLEGLICTKSAQAVVAGGEGQLETLADTFAAICEGMSWTTGDALGMGGLLLNGARAAGLENQGILLPEEARATRLMADCLTSLEYFNAMFAPGEPATHRLAFRECGLSLGLRTVAGLRDRHGDFPRIATQLPLAASIEEFWKRDESQSSPTWREHLDINAVTLAASLTAGEEPICFA